MTKPIPNRFYSLDTLRGLAALSVVFSHWKHFFSIPGNKLPSSQQELHPLAVLFNPLYTDGYRAVDLFFCLSGFIFYWLYSEKISNRNVSLKEFVVLRFSRLYPLHFLTLLLVVAGQAFVHWKYRSFFVYFHNDLYHLGLQLLFASDWGFEQGFSFNGPIWSVSIEVLCYAAFCAVCLLNLRRWWQLGLFVGFSYLFERIGHSSVGRGMFCFFIGGIVFQTFTYLWPRIHSRRMVVWLGGFTALMWLLIPLNLHYDILARAGQHIGLEQTHLTLFGKDAGGFVAEEITRVSFNLLLFPLTILTLALLEAQRGTLGKRLAFLGDISYSTYLLHFPLQLMFVSVAFICAVPSAFFCTPLALLLFFLALIPLSLCSYHFFERPCQSWLRSRLLPPVVATQSPRKP